ncbi:DUF4136 domain-containing protein [Chitinophagaceae bacterium LB-8]|uniref:DUF4136 domain-containing protein n=1 Tax=Paraflavisolibacter caeni TaxID=2982496 RepID=A0A9X2XPN4_9BACT|nr:DUF4136 domain-containing protein [Paraflavisolibacter caeni]MCU7551773.1 DUF4136 domain-containing protein [Paraflavisolibacter caeni]
MKHSLIKPMLVILVAGVGVTSCSVASHTEKAAGIDFSKYQTFAWANPGNEKKADRANNDIIDNNIKNSVSEELEKKGWIETDSNADVLLDYTVVVKRGMTRETEPVYSSPFPHYVYGRRQIYTIWYPSVLLGYHAYNVPFKEGELTVNMFDAKTNKLIWQGWAKGDINSGKITSKEATAEVKSIFKKFNYPSS